MEVIIFEDYFELHLVEDFGRVRFDKSQQPDGGFIDLRVVAGRGLRVIKIWFRPVIKDIVHLA